MAVVLGKNVKIYSGSTGTTALIAAAKACTISVKAEVIEKSSATSQTAKEYIAGRTEWEVAINHLVVSDSPFAGVVMVGGTYTISVVIGTTRKTGTVICQQADIQGNVGALATGSVKLKGSGALT